MTNQPRLRILGTRGVPAQHGGFETFAEHLALYLVANGWHVTVYCQAEGERIKEDDWRGVQRVHIPVRARGALGTIAFDWKATVHSSRYPDLVLTLGYNTASFSLLYRLRGVKNLINMDGIEWRRQKWTATERAWLYFNERAGCLLADHLIADHPEIQSHLATRVRTSKITMIPYGAHKVDEPDPELLVEYGLAPGRYIIVIARPEPENSIFEIVSGFSRKRRGVKLVVLGRYDATRTAYHREVQQAANDEVVFVGAIYHPQKVNALRYHALLYIHGHQVGGTNPSLVEALGASSPILAHDNVFNRWVAGPRAKYFTDAKDCERQLDALLGNRPLLARMRQASTIRHRQMFTWEKVLSEYEQLLRNWLPPTV